VSHEAHVVQVECQDQLDDVVCIAVQRGVAFGVERIEVGPSGTEVVEQHDLVVVGEGRRDVAPHPLVATEAVGEHHRRSADPPLSGDVVTGEDIHRRRSRRTGVSGDTRRLQSPTTVEARRLPRASDSGRPDRCRCHPRTVRSRRMRASEE